MKRFFAGIIASITLTNVHAHSDIPNIAYPGKSIVNEQVTIKIDKCGSHYFKSLNDFFVISPQNKDAFNHNQQVIVKTLLDDNAQLCFKEVCFEYNIIKAQFNKANECILR
jgi:hypothetical protein